MREMLNRQDEVIRMGSETIADLRERLDLSQAQVSQMGQVLAQLQPPKAKAGWWARLLRGA